MVMMHAAVTNLRFMLCRVESIGNENSQFFLLLQTAHNAYCKPFSTRLYQDRMNTSHSYRLPQEVNTITNI